VVYTAPETYVDNAEGGAELGRRVTVVTASTANQTHHLAQLSASNQP